MDMFILCAVAVLSGMCGFWIGRALQWQNWDVEKIVDGKKILTGREIGSPVNGQLTIQEENGRKTFKLKPECGRIYAPAGGRIEHLYPMGRAMVIKTDFGAEIYLQVGEQVSDMCSDYFRCRVMEHEVVKKGKWILEFDPEALEAEGVSCEVLLTICNEADFVDVHATQQAQVKYGEALCFLEVQNYVEEFSGVLT